ncbi:MAG: hypothetical protein IPH51_12720 [Rubrivivax sp.]|nr:hypothetical protein [Rubrivivax sp.]
MELLLALLLVDRLVEAPVVRQRLYPAASRRFLITLRAPVDFGPLHLGSTSRPALRRHRPEHPRGSFRSAKGPASPRLIGFGLFDAVAGLRLFGEVDALRQMALEHTALGERL